METLVLIRGGGDLASGVALRLYRSGLKVLISELEQPLAVRRSVSFAEAVYEGQITIEGVNGRLVKREQIQTTIEAGEIPVLVDPDATILTELPIRIVIDGRLTKHSPTPLPANIPLHIGLGPGFHAGINCHAVIETRRSHTLGRVYWNGITQPDSGQPEGDPRRVLRAPVDGLFIGYAQIGDHLEEGQLIAEVLPQLGLEEAKNLATERGDSSVAPLPQSDKVKIVSPFKGVLRGLIRPGLHVTAGLKIGDVDPREDPQMCSLVSDKALSIGGGALEAILSREDLRETLWSF